MQSLQFIHRQRNRMNDMNNAAKQEFRAAFRDERMSTHSEKTRPGFIMAAYRTIALRNHHDPLSETTAVYRLEQNRELRAIFGA